METSILKNESRNGNFTSSEIHKLIKKGKGQPFSTTGYTYISEKNMERKMRLPLKQDVYSKPIAWGELIELWVHEKHLDTGYESVGKITLSHPTIDFWKGSPDNKNASKSICGDTKGYERKNFAEYAESIIKEDCEALKENREKEYWQLVSNAILMDCKYIQPILYMPYKSELPALREFVDNLDTPDQWRYRFVYDSQDDQLPYLNDNGYYKNLTTCILEVPQADKDYLTERVKEAGKLLSPFYKSVNEVPAL